MNKEQIFDEAYQTYLKHTILGVQVGLDRITGYLDNCLVEFDGSYEHFTNPSFYYGFRPHTQEEFINKCKTNKTFSERWGLNIDERELSLEERNEIRDMQYFKNNLHQALKGSDTKIDWENTPTKLITITYKDTIIESYE